MTWLRTDDGFTNHPKFEGWTPLQKWSFFDLMHYCARYRTKGRIPADYTLLPRGVTPSLITLAHNSKWLDQDESGVYWIHDWNIYNPDDPTATARKRAQRERDQNRDITRDADRDKRRDTDRDKTVTRALAHAVPVPSLLSSDQTAALGNTAAADSAMQVELLTLLTAARYDGPDYHSAEPDRALAWLRRALASPSVENKAGMYRRQMEKPDHWPESNGSAPASVSGVPRPLFEVISSWIDNAGWLDTWQGVEREIGERQEGRGEVLSVEQVEVLRKRWQTLQRDTTAERSGT